VGQHPTARGKIGTKRSGLTDGGGIPMGLAVEGANRHDVTMVEATLTRLPLERPTPTPAQPPGMCRDKGDDDDEVRELRTALGCTAHMRARGEAAKALTQEAGVKARRWGVERTQSWMHRFRRVLIRWDKHLRNDRACLHLACAYMTYRQAGLLG